ncbi:MAG: molybdopterin-dependent oxidoreductase [Deltaproteobacteria bacterium]|nr:molybdopterin-dependent oxidoreductase [Deltaproteobacteria bacterium]
MKIDRRSFLSLIIGGAAGTALSPLPWKLMDDSSIWTQNWPWTPVPDVGEVTHVNSVCALCPGGCGISVRKVDNRVVKIEGNSDFPVNKGGICSLGLAGPQLLYGHTRVKTPLKRVGKRGENRWEKISWDNAVKEVAVKLGRLRSNGQASTVGTILGRDRGTMHGLFDRFLTAYGSANLMNMPSMDEAYNLSTHFMNGVQGLTGFDLENSDFILSLGSGLLDGWGSPVRMLKAHSLWKENNAMVVQVEPRLSRTAAKADKWIPIKPGTEAALALGFANVIINESLFNKEFVEDYSFGFEDWGDDYGNSHKGFKNLVTEGYSPEKVSEITGVNKTDIIYLARQFARASRPLALCGRGRGCAPGSLNLYMSVHALNALTGRINKKGGVWSVPELDYIKWPELKTDAVAKAGLSAGRIDGAGTSAYPYTKSLLSGLPEKINSSKETPVQALIVCEANPVYSLPDTTEVQKAFDAVPFIVSLSSYMDETALNADIILPNHMYLERYEDIPAPFGVLDQVIGLAKPVVEPLYNTQHAGDTIIMLAKALGGSIAESFPWDNYQECIESVLGDKWDSLKEESFFIGSEYSPRKWSKAFETPSSKFEFFGSAVYDAENRANESIPLFTPLKPEGDDSRFPLTLIPYESMRLANGFIGDPPFLMKTIPDTVLKGNLSCVEVNPVTARSLGLPNDKPALLSTPRGSVKVKICYSEGIMPGLVALPMGLGHECKDEYLAGKGVNFNSLISPVPDNRTGMDTVWGIKAGLVKA